MVKHIAFFQISPVNVDEENNLLLRKMKKVFSHLQQRLYYIVEFRTGNND